MQEELATPETEVVVEPQVEIEAPTEAPAEAEPTERERMSEIYRSMNEDEGAEDEAPTGERLRGPDGKFLAKEPQVEATPEAEIEVEPEAEVHEPIEGPTHLSADLRKVWGDIPESARDLISNDHKAFSDRLATQGRQLTAIQPIADQVIEAAKTVPGMSDMTPAQIANDVFKMAQVQGQLNTNPVDTLLQVAHQYGALEGIKARLSGQQVPTQNTETSANIRRLEQENERLREQVSPDAITGIVEQTLSQREIQNQINSFAAEKEHYAQVEDSLPLFIPAAQQILGESASPSDVLARSYDMAINALGLKAEAAPAADPDRTQAAIKAKSVNVKSTSTGRSKPLTEREEMQAAYRRLNA